MSAAVLGTGVVGIIFGILSKRLPLRGWLALAFDLLAAVILISINLSTVEIFASFSLFYLFLIVAPAAGIYSIYAFKYANDRWAVYGGVAGAVVINAFFVFFISMTLQMLFWVVAKPRL